MTHSQPGALPFRHPSTEVAEFATELVVLETRSRQIHLLGPLASLVFDSCDGVTPTEQLVDEVADWSADDRDTVRAAIVRSLDDLSMLGLLAGTEYVAPPPCVGCARAAPNRRRRWWRMGGRVQPAASPTT